MISSKVLRRTVAGVGTVAMPLGVAVVMSTPASASAGPDMCVGGPYGVGYACVEAPWPNHWYDGPRGWDRGHHGHDHDD